PGSVNASWNVFFNNTANGVRDDQAGYFTQSFVVATSEPLGPFGFNGGPTQTLVPLENGAAICAGSLVIPPRATDQRGLPRTSIYGSGVCLDAGAAQFQPPPYAVPTLSIPFYALLSGLLAIFGVRRTRDPTRYRLASTAAFATARHVSPVLF